MAKGIFDAVAYSQHVDALAVDGALVKEIFLAAVISDEPESLVRAQRLNFPCHSSAFVSAMLIDAWLALVCWLEHQNADPSLYSKRTDDEPSLGAIQKIAHGRNRGIARDEPPFVVRERNCVALHEACWQRNEREFVSNRMFVNGVLHGESSPFSGVSPTISSCRISIGGLAES
ncbi:MAG TPA: hypothetical protein VLV86_23650 [Vicinamibacterales bacterium]|nr:hypothetical protein [Vicinamibacterales bacterium]